MRSRFALFCIALSGCALTNKAAPVEIRYFTPDAYSAAADREPVVSASARKSKLRVGRISSSAHLRSRISYRTTTYELGSYETLRWTDNPEAYLRRSLHRSLFETRPMSEVVSGREPVLEVELLAFEQVRSGGPELGRVVLQYTLRDDLRVLTERRVVVERRAAAGGGMENVVAAIGAALDAATNEVAEDVVAALAED